MSELKEVSDALSEFTAWYEREIGPKLSKLDRGTRVIVEMTSSYAWLAARGLDFERALRRENDRLRAELERMPAVPS